MTEVACFCGWVYAFAAAPHQLDRALPHLAIIGGCRGFSTRHMSRSRPLKRPRDRARGGAFSTAISATRRSVAR